MSYAIINRNAACLVGSGLGGYTRRGADGTNRLSEICLFPQGARCSSVVRTFAHGAMGRSFMGWTHDWCNKGRGMYYPVCGMMHIKESLLLIGKSSLCGGSGFPLSLRH